MRQTTKHFWNKDHLPVHLAQTQHLPKASAKEKARDVHNLILNNHIDGRLHHLHIQVRGSPMAGNRVSGGNPGRCISHSRSLHFDGMLITLCARGDSSVYGAKLFTVRSSEHMSLIMHLWRC